MTRGGMSMPSDEIEKTRSEIIHLAREIIEGGEAVVDDSEQLAAKYHNHKPLDVEGFRVALHYARRILQAAENSQRIDPTWVEPILRFDICDDE